MNNDVKKGEHDVIGVGYEDYLETNSRITVRLHIATMLAAGMSNEMAVPHIFDLAEMLIDEENIRQRGE